MKKILSALVITGITLIPFKSYSQEQQGCFMSNTTGQAIDLSHLCGGSGSEFISTPGVFQIPIKRRAGRIPVVDVTFNDRNGRQSFEMLLDTGASATTLSPKMAKALGIKADEFIPLATAGGIIQAPKGRVALAQAGGVRVEDMVVVISPSLSIGLLGQNFFGKYDMTIKANVIEFRSRL